LAEAGQGLLGAVSSYAKGDISGVINAGTSLFKKITTGKGAQERARQTKTSPADVIQFSGCKDNQTSADAVEAVSFLIQFLWTMLTQLLGTSDRGHELGFQRGVVTSTSTELSFVVGQY